MTTLQAARILAAELEHGTSTATSLLEKIAGRDLRLHVTGNGTRRLFPGEWSRLGTSSRAQGRYRTGYLLDGLVPAAVISLVWLPARLTVDACVALANAQIPAGKALPAMERTDRRELVLAEQDHQEKDGLDIAVKASAVLLVDGWRAAIATEWVPRAYLARHGEGPGPMGAP